MGVGSAQAGRYMPYLIPAFPGLYFQPLLVKGGGVSGVRRPESSTRSHS